MAPKSNATIDDGFGKVIESSESERRNESGDSRTKIGDSKSQGRNTESISETSRFAEFDIIDPFDAGEQRTDNTEPKRRGRPRGSKNRTSGSEASKDLTGQLGIESLEALLYSIHFMSARLLEVKELELDQEESKRLAEAVQNVAKHYTTAFDPKKLAIAQLCFTAAGIYAPRVIAIIKRSDVKSQTIVSKPIAAPTPIRPTSQPANNTAQTAPVTFTNPSQLWDTTPIEDNLA